LKMLQIPDLHGNSLNQSIPLKPTQLMALQILSLSSNQFQVPSPQAWEIRSIRRLSPRTETSRLDCSCRVWTTFQIERFVLGSQ
jgi:hypothetical protein